jgi:WD40 repeat protein
MNAQQPQRMNPFIGPRAFEEGRKLHGRNRETSQLTSLLISERIVLLYSPSGAGKTSLVRAALTPRLDQRHFKVLPVMRVNREAPAEISAIKGFNRYIYSTLTWLETAYPEADQLPDEQLARMEFSSYLELRVFPQLEGDNQAEIVLIFDQFEEVLTIDPTDQEARQKFFEQIGAALKKPSVWALFSMREDHIARLDPYRLPIPTNFNHTFRLDLITKETASLIAQETAREQGVTFIPEAADKLMENLCLVKVQRPDGSFDELKGPYVEPVQLQVVCRNLWNKLEPDDNDITPDEIEKFGDVDTSLGEFYATQVKQVARDSKFSERKIREWFDTALITENFVRNQVLKGSGESLKLSDQVINLLEDAHLVRSETRRGSIWYELSHDRLIRPVRNSNTEWFEKHLTLFQRQAAVWEKEKRAPQLVLREEALIEAESWSEAHPDEMNDTEKDFLQACRVAREEEIKARADEQLERERERQVNRRLRRRLWYALGAMGLAIVLMFVAIGATFNLWTQEAISAAGNRAGLAMANLDGKHELALLLAVQAAEYDTYLTRYALLQPLLRTPEITQYLPGHTGWVTALASSPNGTRLASSGWDNMLRLWDTSQPGGSVPIEQYSADVRTIAFSPTGVMFATGGCGLRHEEGGCLQGALQLWDAVTGDPIGALMTGHTDWVHSVRFTPDGKRLISAGEDGLILFWDVDNQTQVDMNLAGHPNIWVSNIAVNHDENRPLLASASCHAYQDEDCIQFEIYLWNTNTGELVQELVGSGDWISSMAFSPDDRLLAAGGYDWAVHLWQVGAGVEILPALAAHNAAVTGVAFSPDGRQLVSIGEDSRLLVWDLANQTLVGEFIAHLNGMTAVVPVYDPENYLYATGGRDGGLILWEINELADGNEPLLTEQVELDFPLFDMALSSDGTWLAIGSCELDEEYGCGAGIIHLYDLVQRRVIESFQAHEYSVSAVAISPDNEIYASGSCAIMDDNGKCTQGAIILWDANSHQPLDVALDVPAGWVTDLVFSPDGEYLVASGQDGSLFTWLTSTWTSFEYFYEMIEEHNGEIYEEITTIHGLAYADESTRLAVSVCTQETTDGLCRDGEIRSLQFGEVVETLRHNSIYPQHITYSLPEKRLAATLDCSYYTEIDGLCVKILTLWYTDGETTSPLGTLNTSEMPWLSTMVFHPAQYTLLTGSLDGRLSWWDVDPGSWRARACQLAGRNLTQKEWKQYSESWLRSTYDKVCEQWPEGR